MHIYLYISLYLSISCLFWNHEFMLICTSNSSLVAPGQGFSTCGPWTCTSLWPVRNWTGLPSRRWAAVQALLALPSELHAPVYLPSPTPAPVVVPGAKKIRDHCSRVHYSCFPFHIFALTLSENLGPIILSMFTFFVQYAMCNQCLLTSPLTSFWIWHAYVLNQKLRSPTLRPCSWCLGSCTQYFHMTFLFLTLLSSDTVCGVTPCSYTLLTLLGVGYPNRASPMHWYTSHPALGLCAASIPCCVTPPQHSCPTLVGLTSELNYLGRIREEVDLLVWLTPHNFLFEK